MRLVKVGTSCVITKTEQFIRTCEGIERGGGDFFPPLELMRRCVIVKWGKLLVRVVRVSHDLSAIGWFPCLHRRSSGLRTSR